MEILWMDGECSVRQVAERIGRHIAYTTVMTTLTRLYNKGLVHRREPLSGRAFFYSPSFSKSQMQRLLANKVVSDFLSLPGTSRESLLTCLLEAVKEHQGNYVSPLLQELLELAPMLGNFGAGVRDALVEDDIGYSPS